jgi:hypothetical protein
LAQPACWPNRPAGPFGPPGLAKPTGSGLGRSTDPAQPPLDFLSPPRLLWRSGSPPPSPGHSGRLRRPLPSPPWSKYSPLRPFQSHQTVSTAASSPRRSMAGSRSGFHPATTTKLQSSPAPSDACGASPRGSWCGCMPVEAPGAVLPVVPR